MFYEAPLPPTYAQMERQELLDRIAARRAELGSSLCILGHHYQCDDVIRFADFVGDSLKLSQQAAAQKVKYIVFCGVHFMAESADILSRGQATVVLPHQMAGCSMSDMAAADDVEAAISDLWARTSAKVVPVTYVNSSAAAKAATARAGGACCTSSNVRNVFAWALEPESQGGAGADKVFSIPDQHLGLNTALALGYPQDQCVVYDPKLPEGGVSSHALAKAKFILWKGHCYVHQKFTPAQVHNVRKLHPGISVIVHPECPHEVVALADAAGSTEQIIQAVAAGKPGDSYAIGTEANLVHRLAQRHTDRFIRTLSDLPAYCVQMARIDLPHLLHVLDGLAEGRVINDVHVPPVLADEARLALERMIAIKAATGLIKF